MAYCQLTNHTHKHTMKIQDTIERLKETSKQLQDDIVMAHRKRKDWLCSDLMTARSTLNLTIKTLETAIENQYSYQDTHKNTL